MAKLTKEQIRILAFAEQLMDEGKVPWVMAPIPVSGKLERLPVAEVIMTELGLKQGQTVNSIILDAIAESAVQHMINLVETQKTLEEEGKLTEDFDFRTMLDKDEPTKH